VVLLNVYKYLISLAEMCGFEMPRVPKVSSDLLLEIQQCFMETEPSISLQVLILRCRPVDEATKSSLLEDFLDHDLPDVTKADALAGLSDTLRVLDRREEAISFNEAAENLYRTAGQVAGPLLMQIERCRIELESGDPDLDLDTLKSKLLVLKAELEYRKHYTGAVAAIKWLYHVAGLQGDDVLRVELDKESFRIADIQGFRLFWILEQEAAIRRWERAGPSTGQMLQHLADVYYTIEKAEAPALSFGIAYILSVRYRTLGDNANAEIWAAINAARPNSQRHSRFLEGQDEFVCALENTTSAPEDLELEMEELQEELRRVFEDVNSANVKADERYLGIMKVVTLSSLYISQFGLRGFPRSKELAETCFGKADKLLTILSDSQQTEWRAAVLESKAQMLFIQHSAFPKPEPRVIADILNKEILCQSIEMYTEAMRLYGTINQTQKVANCQSNLGYCYKQMLLLDDDQSTSLYFGLAAKMFEKAFEVTKRTGSDLQQVLGAKNLLKHWFEGFQRQRNVDSRNALQETERFLRELDAIIDRQRSDLSALGTKEAILAKQNLRHSEHADVVYDIALRLSAATGRVEDLWQWVQKNKARSLSDLLGLGAHIPSNLRLRISSKPVEWELLMKEEQLVTSIQDMALSKRFFARKELETHRKAMRDHDNLLELLDIRTGAPVSLQRLRQTTFTVPSPAKRLTWFVDWLIAEGDVSYAIVSSDGERYYIGDTSATSAQVDRWVKDNLDGVEKPFNAPNSDAQDAFKPLIWLKELIEPILRLTAPGDLLVLSATGKLHRVPIHAAVIDQKKKSERTRFTTLIERNPVVYAPSMTVFEQCMSRKASMEPDLRGARIETNPDGAEGIVLGVYEDPDPDDLGWEVEQCNVYDMCNTVSATMKWGNARCGKAASRTVFETACQANIVHFSGHFRYDSPVLDQGIVLGSTEDDATLNDSGPDAPTESPVKAMANVSISTDPAAHLPSHRIFSVTDILRTPIRASHFSLIGCASATQSIQTGDEPLGVIAALLCAGARSVTGTLWPIDSSVGREFSTEFYGHIQKRNSPGDIVDLAVALQETVIKLKGEYETQTPYCWASFVLHGAWFYQRQ
jgi:CHAT domain-containing protein